MLDLAKELADVRLRKPWPSGMFSKVLLKADDLRMVLIAMENGAIMKEHAANGTVAIHAFEGSLCVHTQDQAYDLNEGNVLTLSTRDQTRRRGSRRLCVPANDHGSP